MRAPRDSKPRPLSRSLARFSSAVAISAALFGAARAGTFFWDGDAAPGNNAASGAGLGGSGIWDTLATTPNWWSGGTTDTLWTNASDTAVFGGAAGTVDLSVPITVGNLVFNTGGYALTSANSSTLTFGTNAIIHLDERTGNPITTTISGPIAGNGLTLNGNGGTLILNYAGTQAATGSVRIRSGALQVNGAVSALDAATALDFQGSGSFRLDNVKPVNPGAVNSTLGALTNTAGDGVVHLERTEAQNIQLTLNFNPATARSVGATGLFETNGNGASLNSTNSRIVLTGASAGYLPGYFAKSETGDAAIAWYDSGGFVREVIYGSDPLTQSTSSAGGGNLIADRHMRITGTQGGQGTQTIFSLAIVPTNATTPTNLILTNTSLLTVTQGGTVPTGGPGVILKTGGDASTISSSGAAGITAGGSRGLIIRTDTVDDTLTIAATAPITATTGALTKSGLGTLILNGTQAFTGNTYVNGGRLTIRGAAAAGGAASTGVFLAGGTYELLGYGANDSSTETIATGKNITVNGPAKITVGRLTPATDPATNKTLSFGTLSIGNQILTADPAVYAAGANPPFAGTYAMSFTGTTTFRDALPPTFNVTGTQASAATPALTLAGKVTGPTGFVKRGTGTLELTNVTNDFGGSGSVVDLQEGALAISSDLALGNSNNTILLNSSNVSDGLLVKGSIVTSRPVALGQVSNAIEVAPTFTLTLNGAVTSNITSDLIKRGTGTLVLANASNPFGGTGSLIDIQGGILSVAAAGSLGSSGNTVQLNGGSLAITGAGTLIAPQKFNLNLAAHTIDVVTGKTLTLNGLITSTDVVASLTKTGGGNLTLTNAANSFGGVGSTLDIQGGGTLTVTSGGALGDPGNVVRLTGGFVGDGTSTASQNITLAQASNAIFNVPLANETFTLAGVLSAAAVDFTKTGPGTLELTNSNLFGGATKIVDIQEGFLAATSDSSLGNASNSIRLGVNGGTVGGLRALGTFTTARAITLNNATNNIDVTQGNTLTLSTAFTLPVVTNQALVKNDLGTLAMSVAQPTWTGPITINSGAILVGNSGVSTQLGTTAGNTQINNVGGLDLTGGVSVAEPLTINTAGLGDNKTMAGSIFGGVLRSISGSNTYSGPITVTGAPSGAGASRSLVFGAESGATLNISGLLTIPVGASAGQTTNLILSGLGNGVFTNTSDISKNVGLGTFRIVKTGGSASTWTFTPALAGEDAIDALEIRAGTFKVTVASTSTGAAFTTPTPTTLTFNGGGTFLYDNTGAPGSGTGSAKAQTLGPLTLNAGDGVVLLQRTQTVAANTIFLTFSNPSGAAFTRAAGATGLFQTTGTNSAFNGPSLFTARVALSGSPALTTGFLNPGLFVLQANGTGTTTSFAWYDTALTNGASVRPIIYASDAGAATVAGGAATLSAQPDKHVQISANGVVTAQGSVQVRTLNMLSGASVALSNNAVLTVSNAGGAGGILKTGGTTATISGGTGSRLEAGAGNELVIRTESGETLNITTSIGNTGALTKSGAGNLVLTGTNSWSGNTYVNGGTLTVQGTAALPSGVSALNLSGGTFTLQADGDATTQIETFATQKNVAVSGGTNTIVIGRLSGLPTNQAANKTVSFGNLSIANQTLQISTTTTSPAGTWAYGVNFTGTTNFTEALPPTFDVSSVGSLVQPSNVVQGLTLSGVVSSDSAVGFVKTGTGTLVLGNSSGITPNTFGGTGALIDIRNGVVAAVSDGALGNAATNVALNVNSSTFGFRATGSFATDRVFYLNSASNTIEVTQGNVMTLNKGINLSSASNTLIKNNNGVLELGANSLSTWTGATTVTINAGAIRLKTASGLGGAGHAVTIANQGSALQLSGTDVVYSAYPLTLSGTGLNNGGALENVSGDNLFTGLITLTADGVMIGSRSGTMTLNGGITAAAARTLTLGGSGNIALITAPVTNLVSSITKIGSGTVTIGVASTAFVGNVVVNAGTLALSGPGKIGGTGTLALNPGSTLTINDTGTPSANRLATRTTTITGGSINLIGSGVGNTSETLTPAAAVFGRGLSTITVTAGTGRQAVLNFAGAFNNVAPAQNSTTPVPSGASVLFRATNLGQPLVNTVGSGAATTHNALPNVAGITFTNGGSSGVTFNGQTGAKDTTNKGILPWALVDTDLNGEGASFATFDTTANPLDGANNNIPGLNPIRALRPAEQSTILTGNANLNLSSALPMSTSSTFNSLTLGAGGGLTIPSLIQLSLSSGGILAKDSNAGVLGGTINLGSGNSPLNVWSVGAATNITISSALTGGQGLSTIGLVKAGAGKLTLAGLTSSAYAGFSGNSFNAQTVINQGTLKLSGGNNTLVANGYLEIGPQGTLDLGGTSQFVQGLFTDSTVAGGGGIITSTGGQGTLVINSDPRTWAGSIQGAVAFSRSGTGALTILSDQSYTGITQFNGNATTLRDEGALSGTTGIAINYAQLIADNNGGTRELSESAGNTSSQGRINNTAPISLRGGTLTVQGRAQTETKETVGAFSVEEGSNFINAPIVGATINAVEISAAGLARPAGSAGTLLITGTGLGLIGSNSRVLTSSLNGTPTGPAGAGLTNNIVGGWAEVNSGTGGTGRDEFVSYVPTLGFLPLGAAGAPAYDNTTIPSGSNPTQNIRAATAAVPSGGATINSLNMAGSINLTFSSSSDILNLVSGGLIGPNSTQTIGASANNGILTAGGASPGATSDLYIFNRNSGILTVNSKITDNGGGNDLRLVLTASGSQINLGSTTSDYQGGTVLNGGTLSFATTTAKIPLAANPAFGLIINGGTVTTTVVGQIAAGNVVTLNGNSTLTLIGDTTPIGTNTLRGLVFNNSGGFSTANAVVNNPGILTFPAVNSGITATSSNLAPTGSNVTGRFNLPAAVQTQFAIDPILFNGLEVAPTQATFAIQGMGSSTGGINKTGGGVLQFNAQSLFSGLINVTGGGIQYGAGNAGSRYAAVALNGGALTTRLNLNGQNVAIGSLAGDSNSVVTNSGGGTTLTTGFANNASPTTFAGRFARFGDGISGNLNVTKIGTGTMNVTGANSNSTGTLSIQGGLVNYSGAANSSFGANTILTGGALTLDNTGANKSNRLGGLGANTITLTISGGTVTLIGNSAADTSETVDTFTVGSGQGVLDLQPKATSNLKMVVRTTFTGLQTGASLFIKNLPTLRNDDFDPMTKQPTILLPNTTTSLNAPTGFTANDTELAIRPDMVASADTGPATSFITKDVFNNLLRTLSPLGSATPEVIDVAPQFVNDPVLDISGASTPTNYDLSLIAPIRENTNSYSVVLRDGAGIQRTGTVSASHGAYGPNATLLTQTIMSGGVLAVAGGSSVLDVPLVATANNVSLIVHAYGNLALTGAVSAGTGGLTKAGTGTLTFGGRGYYTGTTTVNAGTLQLTATEGAVPSVVKNPIAVVATASTAQTSPLTVNGGTLDLNGHEQIFGAISSVNLNTGGGGTITNSAATPVTLTSSTGTGSNFGGVIKEEVGAGALSFVKTGNSTLLLTNVNPYTGSTTLRGGAITLRDSGALSGTSRVDLIYGTLTVDQTQFNPLADLNPTRLAPATPITMRGATLALSTGGSMDGSATFSDVTIDAGASAITVGVVQSQGATAALNLGNLSRVVFDPVTGLGGGTVNFTSSNGTLGNSGFNNPHTFLSQVDGNAVSAATLTNKIIGPWAIYGSGDFASISSTTSVGIIGLGSISGGYSATAITASPLATDNIQLTGNPASALNTTAINVLRVTTNAVTISINTGQTLRFGATGVSGGFLANAALTMGGGSAATNGSITSGGTELYAYINSASTINSVITDGPGGNVSLIKSGSQQLTLTNANTYSGLTVVSQGTLALNLSGADGSAAKVAVPGDLLINNATTTLSAANQLRTNANVTLDGASTLTMFNTNTIGSVSFRNRGGNGNPSVATATNLVLANGGVSTPSISSTNDVLSTTPVISGNSLTLSNAAPVISTSGVAATSLLIQAPMHPFALKSDPVNGNSGTAFGGPVTKIGTGSVAFDPRTSQSGSTDSASNIITVGSTTGLAVGMSVSGTNITGGSTITGILDGTRLQLSAPTATVLDSKGQPVTTTGITFTLTGSTYSNGFIVSDGTLILAASSVIDALNPNNPPLNGPIGTGTLTLKNGSGIMSDGTQRTLHNAVTVEGNFTIGPSIASNVTGLAGAAVTLAGPMALAAGSHTINVNGPLNISTISGKITGANTPLVKAGTGTLVLSNTANATSWTGAITVAEGVLRDGASGAIAEGVDLTVQSGAVFDMPGLSGIGLNQTVRALSGGGAVTNSSTAFSSTLFVGGISQTDTTTVVDSTFDGSISGIVGDGSPISTLSLTKVGAGTLTLTGANTYRGATNVNSGTLRVSISGSLKIGSDFNVNAGSTAEINGVLTATNGELRTFGANSRIRGSGTLGANVTINNGGIIQPILNGVEAMTINDGGILDIKPGGTLLYRADSALNNRIKLTGTAPTGFASLSLASSGTWHLKLDPGDVGSPIGKVFVLFDGENDFSTSLNGNGSPSDNKVGSWDIDFTGTPGWKFDPTLGPDDFGIHFVYQTNSIVLIGVIPEPGSGTMAFGALAAALGLQRFRRRSRGAAAL